MNGGGWQAAHKVAKVDCDSAANCLIDSVFAEYDRSAKVIRSEDLRDVTR